MEPDDERAVRPGTPGMRAWHGFLRVHAVVTRRLDAELRAACGMSLDVYDVLVALHEAPEGRLRMQRLAEAVLITRSNCTRLVDRMSADGLVERRPAARDGRGVEAVLTDAGRVAFRRAAVVHLRGVRRHFDAVLGAEERRVLGDVFARVLARDAEIDTEVDTDSAPSG